MTDLITERAVAFVEQNAARPFFLDVAYNAPHWPYQPPDLPSTARNNAAHLMPHDSATSSRADYAAMVERVDQGVGQILETLSRLGLSQNTIVIFTNDNGGEWLSDNGPLFHRKWTLWEGGIRVPTIIMGITMDLTASILAATGSRVPEGSSLDGINLLPILEGREPEVERTLFWRTNAGNRVQRAVRRGDWKLLIDSNHIMLFDLRTDIAERYDLAGRRQDIARELRPLLAAWEEDVNAEASQGTAASAPR